VAAMDMDRFITEQNMERYRRLASTATTDADKILLLVLLAEEEAKFIKQQKYTPPL
jgi:hypothetical protein